MSKVDPRDTLAILWSEAIIAYEASEPATARPTALHLAAYGHRNALSIATGAMGNAATCQSAGDCWVCDNEPTNPPGVCPWDTPERRRLHVALKAVVEAWPAAEAARGVALPQPEANAATIGEMLWGPKPPPGYRFGICRVCDRAFVAGDDVTAGRWPVHMACAPKAPAP